MTYTKEQLVDALVREYEFLCHDDFDPEMDMSIGEYRVMMEEMTYDELVIETGVDEVFSLDEYMRCYGGN
jgi:hypothetical protein